MSTRRTFLTLVPALACSGRAWAFQEQPANPEIDAAWKARCGHGPLGAEDGTPLALCPLCGCPVVGATTHGETARS